MWSPINKYIFIWLIATVHKFTILFSVNVIYLSYVHQTNCSKSFESNFNCIIQTVWEQRCSSNTLFYLWRHFWLTKCLRKTPQNLHLGLLPEVLRLPGLSGSADMPPSALWVSGPCSGLGAGGVWVELEVTVQGRLWKDERAFFCSGLRCLCWVEVLSSSSRPHRRLCPTWKSRASSLAIWGLWLSVTKPYGVVTLARCGRERAANEAGS